MNKDYLIIGLYALLVLAVVGLLAYGWFNGGSEHVFNYLEGLK